MKDKNIEKAVESASSNIAIEEMKPTEDEIQLVQQALKDDRTPKSFLYDLVHKLKQKDKEGIQGEEEKSHVHK